MEHMNTKPIIGYEGIYSASDSGQIISVKTGKVIKSQITNSGYDLVHLYVDGKRKAFTVHRLVAIAFVPNPENKPQVNHLDGDKRNNAPDNLAWVDQQENVRHAFDNGLMSNSHMVEHMRQLGKKYGGKYRSPLMDKNIAARIPVNQFDMGGNLVRQWESIKAANKAGFSGVSRVVRGIASQCKGFKFEYAQT